MPGISGASPLRTTLLSSVTTGTSQPINVAPYANLVFYVKTNGSPGAGTVVIEEADYDPATQVPTTLTWSAMDTVTLTSGVGDSAQAAKHYTGAFGFVRARVGTTVTVATIDVVLRAS